VPQIVQNFTRLTGQVSVAGTQVVVDKAIPPQIVEAITADGPTSGRASTTTPQMSGGGAVARTSRVTGRGPTAHRVACPTAAQTGIPSATLLSIRVCGAQLLGRTDLNSS
jgi:hypothetical protein